MANTPKENVSIPRSRDNPESNFAHNFKMAAGGVAVLAEVFVKSLLVRPTEAVWAKLTGENYVPSGSLATDLFPTF